MTPDTAALVELSVISFLAGAAVASVIWTLAIARRLRRSVHPGKYFEFLAIQPEQSYDLLEVATAIDERRAARPVQAPAALPQSRGGETAETVTGLARGEYPPIPFTRRAAKGFQAQQPYTQPTDRSAS